jgi:PAS domain S-box-containing protein
MTLAPQTLLLVVLGYLALLLATAHWGDRSPFAERLSRRPWVAALSLGVYATSWSYFGSVGMAAREGPLYLTIYLGPTLACALTASVWTPLARVLRERQLSTLPDLLAYRYRSQALGMVATLFMLAGSLPYQALQLKALVHTMEALSGENHGELTGAVTCAGLVLFGALYGARDAGPRERHDGFVLAVALESVVKLVALLAVAAFGYLAVLHGTVKPAVTAQAFAGGTAEGPWATYLLMSASAAFLLPRQWHLAFTEGLGARSLRTVSFGLPLYLLLLTISVPCLLAAGSALHPQGNPDFFVLDVARASGSKWLLALVFLGGLSAATAMVVVTSIALASMCLTHVVLPLTGPLGGDLYQRLRWLRRGLIALIVVAGYLVAVALRVQRGLSDLGLVSFAAIAQFVPGLLGVLFWPRATARAVLAGLFMGGLGWGLAVLLPLLVQAGVLAPHFNLLRAWMGPGETWSFAVACSLGANALAFALFSLTRGPTPDELEAAAACRREMRIPETMVAASSPAEFMVHLAPALGEQVAEAEVERARADLGLSPDETRPMELRRLRDRIEQNLSGLMGPVLARSVVEEGLTLDASTRSAVAARLWLDEARGLRVPPLRDLERARRYLRRIVEDLPQGVCTVDPEGEVVLWNAALAQLTGIDGARAVGNRVQALPAPWDGVLSALLEGDPGKHERMVEARGGVRALLLMRSDIGTDGRGKPSDTGGSVLLVEDQTEQRALSARIAHTDRLASIGALAAGVAHEIGNPLTGIASVAQNLRHDTHDPDAQERLALIVEQTRRIDRIVRTLVAFAHTPSAQVPSPERAPLHVRDVVEEAITLTRLGRTARRVAVIADVPQSVVVWSDRQRLVQILVNLAQNACDASDDGGTVKVSACREGPSCVIRVIDHGRGMSEAERSRAFEPFFTTKARGAGTGLGLSLVASLVAEIGGTLSLQSEEAVGTTVSVRLEDVGEQHGEAS